ncbi:MAG: hypothetical protein K6U74_15535 [Firmicutes bacterium]|nr:hypothetical protein [Bacillota bacterium]
MWLLFISGLFSVTMWGMGAAFVREASFEAAREYAVYVEESRAADSAMNIVNKGFLFLDTKTAQVDVGRDGDYAVAGVSVKPRITNMFGFFKLQELRREARCVMEYRFRNPGEFSGL